MTGFCDEDRAYVVALLEETDAVWTALQGFMSEHFKDRSVAYGMSIEASMLSCTCTHCEHANRAIRLSAERQRMQRTVFDE